MKPEVRTAIIAANAANAAAHAAKAAADLLTCKPDAWAFVDQAYWFCRAAQEAAQNAADALASEDALGDDAIRYAFQLANEGMANACGVADDLVSLAEEANHEIRR